jgi:asparagine synthase (glutamine-hydrolysing)
MNVKLLSYSQPTEEFASLGTDLYWKPEDSGFFKADAVQEIRAYALKHGLTGAKALKQIYQPEYDRLEKIETFSLGFEGFEASEEKDAEIAAKHFSTNHQTHIISGKTVAKDFEGFIDAMDQPCIDGLNVYLISKYTKQHVTVALSGLGPDELFLGYKWQRSAAAPALINPNLFNAIEPLLHKVTPARYKGVLEYLKNSQNLLTFYSTTNRVVTDDELADLNLSKNSKLSNRAWVQSYDNPNEKDLFSRVSRLDMKLFMGARVLPISDATSMYHSLEVRFPLIDKDLVEFSRSLPASYKINLEKAKHIRPWSKFEGVESYEGSGVKRILYEAFKNDLPQGFGSRAKKGFKFPYLQWMNNELKEFYIKRQDTSNIPEGWHKLILVNWLSNNNISILD